MSRKQRTHSNATSVSDDSMSEVLSADNHDIDDADDDNDKVVRFSSKSNKAKIKRKKDHSSEPLERPEQAEHIKVIETLTGERGRDDIDTTTSTKIDASLKQHKYSTSDNPRRVVCGVPGCEKRFLCKSALDIHSRSHTGERPFKCQVCEKSFRWKCVLSQHEYVHATDEAKAKLKRYVCSVTGCGKRFLKKSKLEDHSKTHSSERPFECQVCKKCFKLKKTLKKHEKLHATDDDKTFACSKCPEKYATKYDLNQHTISEHRYCSTDKAKPYVCSFSGCEKRFPYKSFLDIHSRSHTGERPFKCQVCKKSFQRKQVLQRHENLHATDEAKTKLAQYVCSFAGCGKRFITKQQLEGHSRTHTGERPFKCQVCKKSFHWKCALNRHEKLHATDEEKAKLKWYSCSVTGCGKRFLTKYQLEGHSKTHSSERPFEFKLKSYSCSVTGCGKRFLTKQQLEGHSRTHTGERPFECQICKKCFALRYSLNRHEKTHVKGRAKEKTFTCPKCPNRYGTKSEVNRHVRNFHDATKTIKRGPSVVPGQNKVIQSPTLTGGKKQKKSRRTSKKALHSSATDDSLSKVTSPDSHEDDNNEEGHSTKSKKPTARPRRKRGSFFSFVLPKHIKLIKNSTSRGKVPLTSTSKNIFRCCCGRKFSSHHTIPLHKYCSGDKAKPHVCSVAGCGKAFVSQLNLEEHYRNRKHTKCSRTKVNENVHVTVKSKTVICSQYPKRSVTKHGLDEHLRLYRQAKKMLKRGCSTPSPTKTGEKKRKTSKEALHSNATPDDSISDVELAESHDKADADDHDDEVDPLCSTKSKKSKTKHKSEPSFVLFTEHIQILKTSVVVKGKDPATSTKTLKVFRCCCGTDFNSPRTIPYHKHCSNDKPKQYVCNVAGCGEIFLEKFHLEAHSKTHSRECQICNKLLTGKKDLKRHEKVHASDDVETCQCPKGNATKNCHTNKNKVVQTSTSTEGDEPETSKTPTGTSDEASLFDCGSEPTDQSGHGSGRKLPKPSRTFICSQCPKAFSCRFQLNQHIKISHNHEKNFECNECGKRYSTKKILKVHRQVHSGRRDYKCNLCDRSFMRKNHLDQHIVCIHSDKFGFSCEYCGKGFKLKQSLLAHTRRHHVSSLTNEEQSALKTFSCSECNKQFAGKSNLNQHLKTHSENKGYKCDTCGRQLSSKHRLHHHIMAIHKAPKRRSRKKFKLKDEVAIPRSRDSVNLLVENVFSTPKLLQTLFTFTDFKTLKNCRLVSKLWNNESRTRWRQEAQLVLKGEEGNESSLIEYLDASNIPDDPFMLLSTPYIKYRLEGCNLQLQKGSEMSDFFSKFGPLMMDLQIEYSCFESKADFEAIVFELTPKLEVLTLKENNYFGNPDDESSAVGTSVTQPNLKEFKLKLVEFDSDELVACQERTDRDDGNVNINLPYLSWVELLERFPNMQKTRLENVICSGARLRRHDLQSLFGAIAKLKREGRSRPPLEHLDIVNAFQPALQCTPMPIFRKLRKLRLPLVSLSMDIGVDTEQTTFQKMLERLAPTLRVLKVFRAPYASPFSNIQIDVTMEKLEEMTLIGPIFHDLRFLEFTPKLKMLRRRDKNKILSPLSKQLLSPPQQPPLASVSLVKGTDFKNLPNLIIPSLVEFLDGDELCSADDVTSLARMMPNLEALIVGLNIYGLRAVSQNFKHLKYLEVDPPEVINIEEVALHSHQRDAAARSGDWNSSSIISMLDRIQLTVNGMDGFKALNQLI